MRREGAGAHRAPSSSIASTSEIRRRRHERERRSKTQAAEERDGKERARQDDRFAGGGHLRLPEDLERVEVGCLARDAALELGFQFVGAVHAEIGIVDDEPVVRRERDRAVDRFKAFAKQRVVVIDASPSLPVVAVGDVELGARVAVRGVGALERQPRLGERVAAKEGQSVGHGLRVDAIGADGRRTAAGDLRDGLRLS